MKRLALLLAVLVVASALVAPAAAQSNETTTEVPTSENGTTTTPTTTTAPTDGSSSTSGVAESVRVIPVQFAEEWLSTERITRSEYNTSGPFAMFDLSEPVSSATIEESGARATVLGGGDVVKVTYSADSAGEASLYTLRLNFDDGSTRTVDLYARETNVDVSQSMMDEYRAVVLEQLNEAEAEGYERSPEGLEAHYTALEEKAELLDHFLTEQASRAFATAIAWVSNPLGLILTLLGLAGGSYWLLNRHGRTLEILSGDAGKAARLRDRIALEHEETIQSAADEHLSDIDEVGTIGETYWQDAFGVSTTYELAELFRDGIPVRDREGTIHRVGGAVNLDAKEIEESWLEPITREGRLPSPEIALSHARAAVQRMMSRYGMTEHYQDTYNEIRELQSELDAKGNEIRSGYTATGNPFDSTEAGGD